MVKPALIITSFGVADGEARALGLDKLTKEIQAALPGAEIRQAYTSVFIRKKLLK